MPPLDPNQTPLYRRGDSIPPEYWKVLRQQDPEEVCRRAQVSFSEEKGYRVPFLNRVHFCHPRLTRLYREEEPEASLNFQETLVLLFYLLKAQDVPTVGIKVTEREIPGGFLFFQGPHALFREPLEKEYGRSPETFLRAGLALGGRETGKGEASFELPALPRIPLEYILYTADEEFAAQIIITFDRTVSHHLPLDVLWALVNVAGRRLLKTDQGVRTP
jgi:hypothetical protein